MTRVIIFCVLCCLLPRTGFGQEPASSGIETKGVQYTCPPCGCKMDDSLLSGPGICTHCEMPLILVSDAHLIIQSTLGPAYHDGVLGQLYPKLIYPAYIMAILTMVFLLSCRPLKSTKSINPFLGATILVVALYGFKNQLYGVQNAITDDDFFLFLPISFIVATGPLTYLYVRSLTEREFTWSPRHYLHFIPTSLFFLLYLIPIMWGDDMQQALLSTPFEPVFGHVEQVVAIALGFIYLYYSYIRYRRWKTEISTYHVRIISWIRRYLIGITFFLICWTLNIFINFSLYEGGIATLTYNPFWVVITLLLIWMIFEINRDPKFFLVNGRSFLVPGLVPDEEMVSRIHRQMERIMIDEKPYKNPTLSLHQLASALEINTKRLSAILNTGMGMSFYDYVNSYRIEEVKCLLHDQQHKNFTMEAIANEAGFNSKSSFNSAFKKYTDMTPREYLRHQSDT